jgi:hypothetical protein
MQRKIVFWLLTTVFAANAQPATKIAWIGQGQNHRRSCSTVDPCHQGRGQRVLVILLKNPMNASTGLSMNGNSSTISSAPPLVLRLSKDERRVFQQNPESTEEVGG